jgi:hypothetical protein
MKSVFLFCQTKIWTVRVRSSICTSTSSTGVIRIYGEQVELIASYLDTTLSAGAREVFDRSRTSDRTSLRGGVNYLATSRHDYYVKADAYHKALRKAARALGI